MIRINKIELASDQDVSRLYLAMGVTAIVLLTLAVPGSVSGGGTKGHASYDVSIAKVSIVARDSYAPDIITPSPPDELGAVTAESSITDSCREGIPVAFHSPDMGIVNAPIEQVGFDDNGTPDNPDDDVIADPRSNFTVGWYKYGAKPGSSAGTPVFLAHSTITKESLLPRAAFTGRVVGAIASRSTFQISIKLDHGGECHYTVSPDGMHIVQNKQERFPEVFDEIVNSGAEDNIAFATCAGKWNKETGTSQDSILLEGKK